jgi:hypothetical protein
MREPVMILMASSMARSLFGISNSQAAMQIPILRPSADSLGQLGSSWIILGRNEGRGEAAAELPKSPELPKLIIEKLRQNLTTDQHR